MILVVDDHADTADVLKRLLKMDGYPALSVSTGQAALDYLATNTPDLIILDHWLPDISGFQVFAYLKSTPHLANIPVLMFSANDRSLREEALAKGITAFVTKASLDWNEIRTLLQSLLGPGTLPHHPPAPSPPKSSDRHCG